MSEGGKPTNCCSWIQLWLKTAIYVGIEEEPDKFEGHSAFFFFKEKNITVKHNLNKNLLL